MSTRALVAQRPSDRYCTGNNLCSGRGREETVLCLNMIVKGSREGKGDGGRGERTKKMKRKGEENVKTGRKEARRKREMEEQSGREGAAVTQKCKGVEASRSRSAACGGIREILSLKNSE